MCLFPFFYFFSRQQRVIALEKRLLHVNSRYMRSVCDWRMFCTPPNHHHIQPIDFCLSTMNGFFLHVYNSCYRLYRRSLFIITLQFFLLLLAFLFSPWFVLFCRLLFRRRSILAVSIFVYVLVFFFVVLLRAVCINWVSAPLASHC